MQGSTANTLTVNHAGGMETSGVISDIHHLKRFKSPQYECMRACQVACHVSTLKKLPLQIPYIQKRNLQPPKKKDIKGPITPPYTAKKAELMVQVLFLPKSSPSKETTSASESVRHVFYPKAAFCPPSTFKDPL